MKNSKCVFISYVAEDLEQFRIPDIVTWLEYHEEIHHIFYWERDNTSQQTLLKYMEERTQNSDIIIVFFSKNAKDSIPVQKEIEMATYLNKPIIPVFENLEDLPLSLKIRRGVEYKSKDTEHFQSFLGELFQVMMGYIPEEEFEAPDESEMFEYNNERLFQADYEVLKKLEQFSGKIVSQTSSTSKWVGGGLNFKAIHGRVIGLGLDKEFTQIPTYIQELHYLRQLNLGRLMLTEIPSWIGNFDKLEMLNISTNPIREIPREIGHLKNLRFLYSKDTLLTKLPDSLSQLDNLEELYLKSNPFTHEPICVTILREKGCKVTIRIFSEEEADEVIRVLLDKSFSK